MHQHAVETPSPWSDMRPVEAKAGRIEIDRAARRTTLSEGEAAHVAVGLGIADECTMVASRPGLHRGKIEASLKAPEMTVELRRKDAVTTILSPFSEGAAPPDRHGSVFRQKALVALPLVKGPKRLDAHQARQRRHPGIDDRLWPEERYRHWRDAGQRRPRGDWGGWR